MCLAIPARILEILDEEECTARVEIAGVTREVNVALLRWGGETLAPGDWVLIHVGFAMSRIDEAEAERTLGLLREMGAAFEAELAELAGGGEP